MMLETSSPTDLISHIAQHNTIGNFFPKLLLKQIQVINYSSVGRASNNNPFKVVRNLFYLWVQDNRTPTGRHQGIKYYLLPRYRSLVPTHRSDSNPNLLSDLSSSFRMLLVSTKVQGINMLKKSIKKRLHRTHFIIITGFHSEDIPSHSTIYSWFREKFSHDTDIHPHKSDYCNKCAEIEGKITSVNQTLHLMSEHVCCIIFYLVIFST